MKEVEIHSLRKKHYHIYSNDDLETITHTFLSTAGAKSDGFYVIVHHDEDDDHGHREEYIPQFNIWCTELSVVYHIAYYGGVCGVICDLNMYHKGNILATAEVLESGTYSIGVHDERLTLCPKGFAIGIGIMRVLGTLIAKHKFHISNFYPCKLYPDFEQATEQICKILPSMENLQYRKRDGTRAITDLMYQMKMY